MQRIKRGKPLFTPTEIRHHGFEIRVNIVQNRRHLPVFRENMRVNDAVEMFLIEIINRKSAGDNGVDAVGSGDVVVERNGDKNIQLRGDFRDFTKQNAVIAHDTRSSFECRVNKQHERQFTGFFRRLRQQFRQRIAEARRVGFKSLGKSVLDLLHQGFVNSAPDIGDQITGAFQTLCARRRLQIGNARTQFGMRQNAAERR